MRKLFYVGLEPYEGRYTLQLQDWNVAEFERMGVDYQVVPGELLDFSRSIVNGEVLDAHGRSVFSMSQISWLVKELRAGNITSQDVIFFEDMFTPGIESLAYIFDQTPSEYRPKVVVRCLAQTIDPDDFVHRTGMFRWMRRFEQMVDEFVDGIICASEEMVAHLRIAGIQSDAFVSGLPFGKEEVYNRVKNPRKALHGYEKIQDGACPQVLFGARWATEKQPDFFMDIVEHFAQHLPKLGVRFVVCQGGPLRSDNVKYIERARALQEQYPDTFCIMENLKKDQYYDTLAESAVIFNCALQDWVSNTISEGDTLGAIPIYPAYRSFPETCLNIEEFMYIPWSQQSAIDRILGVVGGRTDYRQITGRISTYQDRTIERTVRILKHITSGDASPDSKDLYRGSLDTQEDSKGNNYRSRVSETKEWLRLS